MIKYHYGGCQMVIFDFHDFILIYLTLYFKKLFLIIYLFILSMWTYEVLFCSIGMFWCSNYPRFSRPELLRGSSCVLLMCPHHSFSIFAFRHKRYSRIILYLPCPSLESIVSLRSTSSFQWWMVLSDHDRNMWYALCAVMSLLLGLCSRQN